MNFIYKIFVFMIFLHYLCTIIKNYQYKHNINTLNLSTMKKIIFLLTIVTILFASCSKNEHVYSIPKDAALTVSIDPASLLSKMGASNDLQHIENALLQQTPSEHQELVKNYYKTLHTVV